MSELIPPPPVEPEEPPAPAGIPRKRVVVIGLVALGLVVALALGYWAISSIVNPPGQGSPQATGAPSDWCFSVNGVPVACDAPETLEVHDRLISIQGVATADGLWRYFGGDPEHEDWASWVQGTVVNYVLGLGTSERNNALFNDIDSGSLLTLTLASGTQMVYRYTGYTEVASGSEQEVFAQKQPALTLVLLGTGQDTKYVISCAWVATYRTGDAGSLPGIGATETIDESDMTASVTVLSASYLRDASLGLPEGNAYFLIDFTVTYTGADVLDTQAFNMLLADGDNAVIYAPSASAGPYGRYPQPVGLLQDGESITATLGYLVGELPGNSVRWEVQLRATDMQTVTFQIPFSSDAPGRAARAAAVVTVSGMEITAEGNLAVLGNVANPSGETLNVLSGDLMLTTGGGTSPLITADPPAPWYVTAGGQTPFRVVFLRPPTGTAIFSLLGRQFIISNIP